MITFEKGGWGKHKSRGLRLKDIDEARADLIEEINRNDLISKEHKKDKFDFELHWVITYWKKLLLPLNVFLFLLLLP